MKFKLKSGDTVKVITGKYKNIVDKIKKINKKDKTIYLEKIIKTKFVKNPNSKLVMENNTKEIFVPINISNVVFYKE